MDRPFQLPYCGGHLPGRRSQPRGLFIAELRLHVADRPDAVIANRRKVAARLGVSFEALTFADQVHGNDIAIITERERGMGRESMETALQKTDGFVSNVAGVVLCAMFADCVPLYFVDPVRKAVGLAHAGWKGTVLRIAEKTVRAMTESFGSRPEDILGAVGPSIGVCCYEVDQMVIDRVKEALGPDNFGDAGIMIPCLFTKENRAENTC